MKSRINAADCQLAPRRTIQPFQQGSQDRSGVSLGLSISRRAIEANGGTLTVRNLAGSGCVFTVDLPAADRYTETAPCSPASQGVAPRRRIIDQDIRNAGHERALEHRDAEATGVRERRIHDAIDAAARAQRE